MNNLEKPVKAVSTYMMDFVIKKTICTFSTLILKLYVLQRFFWVKILYYCTFMLHAQQTSSKYYCYSLWFDPIVARTHDLLHPSTLTIPPSKRSPYFIFFNYLPMSVMRSYWPFSILLYSPTNINDKNKFSMNLPTMGADWTLLNPPSCQTNVHAIHVLYRWL